MSDGTNTPDDPEEPHEAGGGVAPGSSDSTDDHVERELDAGRVGADPTAAGAHGAHIAPVRRPGDGEDDTDAGQEGLVVDGEIVNQEDLADLQAVIQAASITSSGPIPRADELHKYDQDERERIFKIAEAFSTDESKRRDEIVDSSTKIAKRAQWITPGLLIVAFSAAFGSYAAFENVVLSGFFLSFPVLQVIGSTVSSAISRGKSED